MEWSRSTNISRACTWGSAIISATLLTGAAGTPAVARMRTTSAFTRAPVHRWMIAAISSRRSRRAAAVANSGARVRSSRPMTAQNRAHTALPSAGALPVVQGGDDAESAQHAGVVVRDGLAGPGGRSIGIAGDAHVPADRLREHV